MVYLPTPVRCKALAQLASPPLGDTPGLRWVAHSVLTVIVVGSLAACGIRGLPAPPSRATELDPSQVAKVLRADGHLDAAGGELLDQVSLALVPVAAGWEAPLVLRFGGWNECPMPMVHAATLRDWHRRFGAELVALTGDIVELKVARPPDSRGQAMAVANEQYLYCGDIVWQGTETIETLAASLVDAPVWYFWWD